MSSKTSPNPADDRKELIEFSDHRHSVQFYTDDNFLLDALSRFIGSAIGAGDAGIVIATEDHRTELAQRLVARGLDLTKAVEQGRYVALDASAALSEFMVDGWPDEKRFVDLIGGIILRAKTAADKEHGRAALFGEMVSVLWGEGKPEAALRLEQLWNQLAQSHAFSLVCGYPLSKFYLEGHGEAFQKICDEHSAVLPAESYALASEDERGRLIAQWQQKALALEAEIAQRRQTEQVASRLASIVEWAEDAIASKDLNGTLTSWNASAERMFGYKAAEIIGKSVTTIIPPELQKDEDMILGKIRSGERIEHFETVRVAKDGRRLDVSLTISPLKDENGKIIGAAKIVRDITERKRTEEALRKAEKLAATGQLAASIAHEVNNPLQALTNLLALIAYKTSLDSNTRELVAMAEAELGRLSHIVRQMLSFYRESLRPAPVKITEVLEDVLDLFVMRMRANEIRVERRYEFSGEIQGFPAELRQLFANLISNAIEAIGEKGRLQIHIAPGHELIFPQRQGVRVLISDTGRGVKSDICEHIFKPFFTTKSEKGTGLGLWVVETVVARHEGSIRMRSSTAPGRTGTLFSVFLPLELAACKPSTDAIAGNKSVA
jgi:PAS domain S-box-containing protein